MWGGEDASGGLDRGSEMTEEALRPKPPSALLALMGDGQPEMGEGPVSLLASPNPDPNPNPRTRALAVDLVI